METKDGEASAEEGATNESKDQTTDTTSSAVATKKSTKVAHKINGKLVDFMDTKSLQEACEKREIPIAGLNREQLLAALKEKLNSQVEKGETVAPKATEVKTKTENPMDKKAAKKKNAKKSAPKKGVAKAKKVSAPKVAVKKEVKAEVELTVDQKKKIEKVLACKELTQGESVILLNNAGLSNGQITTALKNSPTNTSWYVTKYVGDKKRLDKAEAKLKK